MADLEPLHATFTLPGVRQFIFDDHIIPREQTQEIIDRSIALFAEHGFGLWLAHERADADADITGIGAYWYFREPPELELLYGVADHRVGRGYGLEIATALVQYGFDVLRMPVIRASTDAPNVASQRLLGKLAFAFERRAIVNGLDTLFYTRANPAGVARPDEAPS